MLEWIRFALTAVLLLSGLFLMITAVVAQYRFKYVINRMHAASMSDSLGLTLMYAGLCLSAPDGWTVIKFILIIGFLWITSPTAGHLITRLELTSNEHPEKEMEVVEK